MNSFFFFLFKCNLDAKILIYHMAKLDFFDVIFSVFHWDKLTFFFFAIINCGRFLKSRTNWSISGLCSQRCQTRQLWSTNQWGCTEIVELSKPYQDFVGGFRFNKKESITWMRQTLMIHIRTYAWIHMLIHAYVFFFIYIIVAQELFIQKPTRLLYLFTRL